MACARQNCSLRFSFDKVENAISNSTISKTPTQDVNKMQRNALN